VREFEEEAVGTPEGRVGLLAPLRASDTPIGDIHVTARSSRRYAPWLWVLAALFCARVFAQPIALVFHPGFLPPFDAWHSAVLPYQLLLASQGVILFWLAWTAARFSTAAVTPNRRIGVSALILGTLYFSFMALRLLLGATILHGQRWFARPLPTVFHLVLATYLILFAHFHYHRSSTQAVGGTEGNDDV